MHIPDGFLSPATIATTMALSATGLAVALGHANRTLPTRKIPLLGLSAAFVFAAQMVNFPVAGGTSGHLTGATLVAVLLGPSAAIIVMSAVLITQCLMFADGGVTALGANTLNMALINGFVGWSAYSLLRSASSRPAWRILSAGIAAWLATVLAALACSAELAASGAAPLHIVLPAMAGWHTLIGLGEAAITIMVLSTIATTRPELLLEDAAPRPKSFYWSTAAYGMIIALALALLGAPLASTHPDGLERVAGDAGFAQNGRPIAAPMADYKAPAVSSASLATALAGGTGTLMVCIAAVLTISAVTLFSRRARRDDLPPEA